MKTDFSSLWGWLALLGVLGSLSGCAALLRSTGKLDGRSFAAAILNSALFSIAIGLLMIWRFGDEQVPLTVAISTLAGLGGNETVNFAITLLTNWAESRVKRKDD